MSIIETIRQARTDQGITQAELADRVYLTQAKISKLENGNLNITLRSLERIIKTLGITVCYTTYDKKVIEQ